METISENLKTRFEALKSEGPIRIREAANKLGVSEAELVALSCGDTAVRLRPEFAEILGQIEQLGYVMALTRNDEVVHERKGVYQNGSFGPGPGLFVGKDIDLRIFLSVWASAFAVTEWNNAQPRFSLQFFGKDGEAVHKIYMEPKSDLEWYHALVRQFQHEDQGQIQEVERNAYTPETELPDSEIDVAGFRKAWEALDDTHAFFGMLKTYKVTRTQALRLAPSTYYAQKISNQALKQALDLAAADGTSIMVFVGNRGMIQIHTGAVKNIVMHGPWLNVLDPTFNLHVKEAAISESWVVRKPTTDGVVTSLELFNAAGELICTLFGERKPGIPELEAWRTIVSQLN